MNITELLVTAYDGDKPVLAIDLDQDSITTVLTAIDETGIVEAATRNVVAVDEQAARVLDAVRALAQGLGAQGLGAQGLGAQGLGAQGQSSSAA
jgi:hypothetical protein